MSVGSVSTMWVVGVALRLQSQSPVSARFLRCGLLINPDAEATPVLVEEPRVRDWPRGAHVPDVAHRLCPDVALPVVDPDGIHEVPFFPLTGVLRALPLSALRLARASVPPFSWFASISFGWSSSFWPALSPRRVIETVTIDQMNQQKVNQLLAQAPRDSRETVQHMEGPAPAPLPGPWCRTSSPARTRLASDRCRRGGS